MKDNLDLTELYELGEIVGEGAFGSVYKARYKTTGETVAVKIVSLERTSASVKQLEKEMELMAYIQHPQIVKYITSFICRETELWIIMEFVSGGTVLEMINAGPMSEEEIAEVCYEVLKALDYLHKQSLVHRDVKADNILLHEDGSVKLADFSISTRIVDMIGGDQLEFAGSLYWLSPEVVQEKGRVSNKSDIWSLGITAIELAKGVPPYFNEDSGKVIQLIQSRPSPELTGNYSSTFKEFVECCLEKDVAKRCSADQLLKHKFFKKVKKQTVLVDVVKRFRAYKSKQAVPQTPKKTPKPKAIETDILGPNGWDFSSMTPTTLDPEPLPEKATPQN